MHFTRDVCDTCPAVCDGICSFASAVATPQAMKLSTQTMREAGIPVHVAYAHVPSAGAMPNLANWEVMHIC